MWLHVEHVEHWHGALSIRWARLCSPAWSTLLPAKQQIDAVIADVVDVAQMQWQAFHAMSLNGSTSCVHARIICLNVLSHDACSLAIFLGRAHSAVSTAGDSQSVHSTSATKTSSTKCDQETAPTAPATRTSPFASPRDLKCLARGTNRTIQTRTSLSQICRSCPRLPRLSSSSTTVSARVTAQRAGQIGIGRTSARCGLRSSVRTLR